MTVRVRWWWVSMHTSYALVPEESNAACMYYSIYKYIRANNLALVRTTMQADHNNTVAEAISVHLIFSFQAICVPLCCYISTIVDLCFKLASFKRCLVFCLSFFLIPPPTKPILIPTCIPRLAKIKLKKQTPRGFEPATSQINVFVATTTPHVCLCLHLL
jgi:hypothetical protein